MAKRYTLYSNSPNQVIEDYKFNEIVLLNGTEGELETKNAGVDPMKVGELGVVTDKNEIWHKNGSEVYRIPLSPISSTALGTGARDFQSGRSLSSQTASGTCSTISGGSGNTASRRGSVISGGVDNTASGYYDVIAGGGSNSTSGILTYNTIGGGCSNTISGYFNTIGGGCSNTISCRYSTVAGGRSNTVSSSYSAILGGYLASTDKWGQRSYAAGQFSAQGDSQQIDLIARNRTTNSTATDLFLNGSNQRVTIVSGKTLSGIANIVGIKSDGSTVAHFIRKFSIKNVSGTTSLSGSISTIGVDVKDDNEYNVSLTSDDTNDALSIKVTGKAAETLRWTTHIQGIEIAYGV